MAFDGSKWIIKLMSCQGTRLEWDNLYLLHNCAKLGTIDLVVCHEVHLAVVNETLQWDNQDHNINWSDVQRKDVVNNVDMSSLKAPWQYDPHKNKHIKQHKTHRTPKCNRHSEKMFLCVFRIFLYLFFIIKLLTFSFIITKWMY